MNFFMTGSYSVADSLSSDKSYFEAQAKGQVRKLLRRWREMSNELFIQLSGDCTPYHEHCPVSFFKYFG